MLTKCPFDTYAYYDLWGDRHLVFDQSRYDQLTRWLEHQWLVHFSRIWI